VRTLGHRPLDVGSVDPVEIRPPDMLPAKCGRSKSNGTSVLVRKSAGKIWPLARHLSRSLKITGTNTDRSTTYDFLLVIRRNHGTISYRFRNKRRFRSKIANFPHTTATGLKMMALYTTASKSVTCPSVLPALDRWQTDRRTDEIAKTISRSHA